MKAFRALLLAMLMTGGVKAMGQELDWWQSQRHLSTALLMSNTPIAELVRTVTARPAPDPAAAMWKVCVLLRAGMNEQAIDALHELKSVRPALEGYQASSIYRDACAGHAWSVAQAVSEAFAETMTEWGSPLLTHWLESGWSFEQIDEWFAARPARSDAFWVKERLRFAQSRGRAKALLRQLSEDVRRNPADVTGAIRFLDALLHAGGSEQIDLSWFEGLAQPARAIDAKALGSRLRQLERFSLALDYYQQAITIPLTNSEVRELGTGRSMMVSAEMLRADFAASAREAMAECLLTMGRNDEAQQRMVEAADIRERHGVRRNALLAGRVQAASGARTMERRIVEAERKSENDPEYWLERASYFRGRGEKEREEEALKKGLSLSKPEPLPDRPGRHSDLRSRLLSAYAHFLAREERENDAVAVLRNELAKVPAAAESSRQAARLLGFEFNNHVRAGDPVLWRWLANRPEWKDAEERLLWRMLEDSKKIDEHLTKAERLSTGADPSRAVTLAWIMNALQQPARSIPLLKKALAQSEDAEVKERAALTLLESFLDTGNWSEAESIFPEASRRFTGNEIPEWYIRLALVAARAGDKADALRLWARTANVKPTALEPIVELAALGLRDQLIAFYKEMENQLPESQAPRSALELLGGS